MNEDQNRELIGAIRDFADEMLGALKNCQEALRDSYAAPLTDKPTPMEIAEQDQSFRRL